MEVVEAVVVQVVEVVEAAAVVVVQVVEVQAVPAQAAAVWRQGGEVAQVSPAGMEPVQA